MSAPTLDEAFAAVLTARNLIARIWDKEPAGTDLEERLDFANGELVNILDGYRCTSPVGCIKRMGQLGQWIGKRVLRRIDVDGTEWVIRPHIKRTLSVGPEDGFSLTCHHRNHRLVTHHASVDAAKTHVEEFLVSLTDRDIDAYREPVADEQMELL